MLRVLKWWCDAQVPACREFLAKIFQELSLHKSPCVKERTPSAPCVLYIVGGFSHGSLDLFEGFTVAENKWTSFAPLPKSRSGLGGAALGKKGFSFSSSFACILSMKPGFYVEGMSQEKQANDLIQLRIF